MTGVPDKDIINIFDVTSEEILPKSTFKPTIAFACKNSALLFNMSNAVLNAVSNISLYLPENPPTNALKPTKNSFTTLELITAFDVTTGRYSTISKLSIEFVVVTLIFDFSYLASNSPLVCESNDVPQKGHLVNSALNSLPHNLLGQVIVSIY